MKTTLPSRILCAVFAAVPLAQAPAAPADAYPSRTIRIVVPYPAGGGADAMARFVADRLQESVKQPVIIDNKPGAGSAIGSEYVARAQPDGYTLLFNIPSLIQTSLLQKGVSYDPIRDFVPITTGGSAPVWFAVSTGRIKATDFAGFRSEAKALAKGADYGSWGMGTTNHLYGELLTRTMGIKGVHVPYKGSAPAVMALANGEVDFLLTDYVTVRPHVESGRVRILASTGLVRHRLTPNVPTLSELGFAGFESVGWGGFFAPRGTPVDVIDKLEREISAAARDPRVSKKFLEMGYEKGGKPRAEFTAEVEADAERWKRIVQSSGLQAE